MIRAVRLCLCVCLIAAAHPAAAATAIGKVDRVQGSCQGAVDGSAHDLSPDGTVFVGEVISTGPEARLALTFEDGTVLTVGEKARVSLDDFVFRPNGENRLHMAIAGAFRFVSGTLGRGATRNASVTTPAATIGVRGTDFWGGPIDGHFGVVLLEGAITVSTRGGGVTVRDAGQGVDIGDEGTPPGPVEAWSREKLDQALATVTFR